MTEQQATLQPSATLSKIFASMNMAELPAMSQNVQKLISLTGSSSSSSTDLANTILKDYSLTNKVLQIVNSAYYSLGQACNSISKAVTILGFDVIRDMAMVIALFEDFIKSGTDKEGISKLLACSFLSGALARELVEKKKINVSPEEAFICALFYNLGKSIVCIYLPDKFNDIETNVDYGMPRHEACRAVFGDLTYHEIGSEVAKFWNLSDKIVTSMEDNPKAPKGKHDSDAYLQNLAGFANALVDAVCDGSSLGPVFHRYGSRLTVTIDETIALLGPCIGVSETVSDTSRYGLSKLKIRTKLKNLEINVRGGFLNSASPEEQEMRNRLGLNDGDTLIALPLTTDDSSTNAGRAVLGFIREIGEALLGSFEIQDFYRMLLDAFHLGIGFDRVVLALINHESPAKPASVSCFYSGEIAPEEIRRFGLVLSRQNPGALANALKLGRDMMIPANKPNAFPDDLLPVVKDRTVYLLPISIDGKGVGIIYLDRKAERPLLDQDMTKSTRLLRDFAVQATRKITIDD